MISKSTKNEQVLDRLQVERERGITVKAQSATLVYKYKGTEYLLNLIDTPVSDSVTVQAILCQTLKETLMNSFIMLRVKYGNIPDNQMLIQIFTIIILCNHQEHCIKNYVEKRLRTVYFVGFSLWYVSVLMIFMLHSLLN